jgi:hypothetical protein
MADKYVFSLDGAALEMNKRRGESGNGPTEEELQGG